MAALNCLCGLGFALLRHLIVSSASLAFLAYSLEGFIRVRRCPLFVPCLMSFALERPRLRIQNQGWKAYSLIH